MAQTIKVSLGGRLLKEVLAAAALDEVSASEVIRRILWSHVEARGGADRGPSGRRAPLSSSETSATPATEPDRPESGPEPDPSWVENRPQAAPVCPSESPSAASGLNLPENDLGPNPALSRPESRYRPSSLPRPLPSPQGRGFPQETKATAKAKAPASGDSPNARCSGGAREAPAYARPGRQSGPDSAQLGLGPQPVQAPGPPPVLWLPCRACRPGDPPSWGLAGEQIERWRVAFPGLDVLGEVRKAEAWLQANPGRWKSPRGIERFLFSWLERANDRGRFARFEGAAGRAGTGWSPAVETPAPPPKGSILEAYGFNSFEEWADRLRKDLADEPKELAKCLGELDEMKRRWEAKHAA